MGAHNVASCASYSRQRMSTPEALSVDLDPATYYLSNMPPSASA